MKNPLYDIAPLYDFAVKCRSVVYGGVMRLFHAVSGVKKRAVFSSFRSLSYSDGPMRVSELLHNASPDTQIVWLLDRHAAGLDRVPDYVRAVRPRGLKALYHLSTSRVIVDNFNLPFYRIVAPDQFMVQLWHGDRPFKKIMFDYKADAGFIDAGATDLCVSGSAFGTQLYRRAFRYEGQVLETGTPRCDILVDRDPALVRRVRESLGIKSGTKVLLYAPTFRDSLKGGSQASPLSLHAVRQKLESGGEKWTTLCRGHGETRELLCDADRDVSDWPDMNELLLISDILITDYSSCAADFALTGRAVYLFRPDEAEYTSRDRELYFTSSPFRTAASLEELLSMLPPDADDCTENCRAINEFFGTHETGHAARDTVDIILRHL